MLEHSHLSIRPFLSEAWGLLIKKMYELRNDQPLHIFGMECDVQQNSWKINAINTLRGEYK